MTKVFMAAVVTGLFLFANASYAAPRHAHHRAHHHHRHHVKH